MKTLLAVFLLSFPALATVTSSPALQTTLVGSCNGVSTGPYTIPFAYQQAADLYVNASSTPLVQGTDYILSVPSTNTTATLTLTAGSKCPAGLALTAARVVPLTQLTSFIQQGTYSPKSYEKAVDKLTMAVQQLATSIINSTSTGGGSSIANNFLTAVMQPNSSFSIDGAGAVNGGFTGRGAGAGNGGNFYGGTSPSNGVTGTAPGVGGWGVYGLSQSSFSGVYGTNNATGPGVQGIVTAGNGSGVSGIGFGTGTGGSFTGGSTGVAGGSPGISGAGGAGAAGGPGGYFSGGTVSGSITLQPQAADPTAAQNGDLWAISSGPASFAVRLNGAPHHLLVGSCALNAATPAICTATVPTGVACVATPQGVTAAIASRPVATSVSATTLTITGPAADGDVINYQCF